MFLLRVVLNILVRNASPRGPMCFRCQIINLSGHCKLLCLLCYCLLDLRSGECDVVSLCIHVFVWVCLLFCC